MKKNLVTQSILAAGVLGVVISASAAPDLKFYVGAGMDYNTYSYGDAIKKNNNIIADGLALLVPVLGIKFHKNFRIESGYSFNKKIRLVSFGKRFDGIFKAKNMYLDLVGYMPVADKMELIGGIGLGKVTIKKGDHIVADVAGIKNNFNWRTKIGVQYNINTNFATTITATYQQVGNKVKILAKEFKLIKNIKTIRLGVVYTF